jgi:hypothetical protein
MALRKLVCFSISTSLSSVISLNITRPSFEFSLSMYDFSSLIPRNFASKLLLPMASITVYSTMVT